MKYGRFNRGIASREEAKNKEYPELPSMGRYSTWDYYNRDDDYEDPSIEYVNKLKRYISEEE